jgi:protein-disulfide isomerase
MEKNTITKEKGQEFQRNRVQPKPKSKAKIIVWSLVAIAIIGLVWSLSSGSTEKSSAVNTLTAIVSDDYIIGPVNAPVTLIEYLDFECEACGAYFPLIKQLEKEFSDDLRVVMRYFPLPGHKNGLTAALAVEAAAQQGKYNEMHDLLFEEQENWGEQSVPNPSIFEEYAKKLGLDMERFRQDVSLQSVRDRVQRDVDSGRQLGNTGTPSFFLNGKKINNPRSYEAFRQLILDEIEIVGVQHSTSTQMQN